MSKIPPIGAGAGNTIYACDACEFVGWGAAVFYHEHVNRSHAMKPLGYYRFNRWTNTWTWIPSEDSGAERTRASA
jgi:hypothetical protein